MAISTRAKFKCVMKSVQDQGTRIVLNPVQDGSEENKNFFNYTPFGQLDLGLVRPSIAEQFEFGGEYYIDITPVTPKPIPAVMASIAGTVEKTA